MPQAFSLQQPLPSPPTEPSLDLLEESVLGLSQGLYQWAQNHPALAAAGESPHEASDEATIRACATGPQCECALELLPALAAAASPKTPPLDPRPSTMVEMEISVSVLES